MIDGFTLNGSVTGLPERFASFAVPRARRAFAVGAWRPRVWVVPQTGLTLQPYDKLIEQVFVSPGSILWGYQFAALTGTLADFLVQVRFDDEAHSPTLWSKPVFASALRSTGGSGVRPVLLTAPRPIGGTSVSALISSRSSATRRCQLLLFVGEPWSGGVL